MVILQFELGILPAQSATREPKCETIGGLRIRATKQVFWVVREIGERRTTSRACAATWIFVGERLQPCHKRRFTKAVLAAEEVFCQLRHTLSRLSGTETGSARDCAVVPEVASFQQLCGKARFPTMLINEK